MIVTGWAGDATRQVVGPILPTNVWAHVTDTFSSTNGNRLYVNGTVIGSIGAMAHGASGQENILTLGHFVQGIQQSTGGSCQSQSIVPAAYSGSIDEFRIYSRVLSAAGVTKLALR